MCVGLGPVDLGRDLASPPMRLRLAASILLLAPVLGACRSLPAASREPAERAPTETVQTVYVVRHSERLSAAGDPPLSAAGEARARALADSLVRWGAPGASFATRFARAQRTAQLAAPALTPQRYDVSPDAAADARALGARVLAAAAAPDAAPLLIVGHSNTVPSVLTALDGRPRPDLNDADYDGVYVVRIHRRTAGGDGTAESSVVRVDIQRRRVGVDDGVPDPS